MEPYATESASIETVIAVAARRAETYSSPARNDLSFSPAMKYIQMRANVCFGGGLRVAGAV
jgi:hypothetical protein